MREAQPDVARGDLLGLGERVVHDLRRRGGRALPRSALQGTTQRRELTDAGRVLVGDLAKAFLDLAEAYQWQVDVHTGRLPLQCRERPAVAERAQFCLALGVLPREGRVLDGPRDRRLQRRVAHRTGERAQRCERALGLAAGPLNGPDGPAQRVPLPHELARRMSRHRTE